MPPLARPALREIIKSNRGGTYHSEYGPTQIGGKTVWEIWVTQDGLFENRFIVETNAGGEYYDSFQTFAPVLNNQIQETLSSGPTARANIHLMTLRAYVAAFVFILAVVGSFFIAFTNKDSDAVTAILGVVASGAAFFFGRWLPVQ